MAYPKSPRETRTCARPECENQFEIVVGSKASGDRLYCGRSCARTIENRSRSLLIQQAWNESSASLCVCGEHIPYERRAFKYHSAECANTLQEQRKKNPENYVTFDCETCGVSVTRYKNLKTFRFCSNECSAKSNTQRRISVDDIVCDSSYEALFWGLCCMLRIPIERFDRDQCVAHNDGWYGPDFVVEGMHIEVKGREDDDDRDRYDTWRQERGPLVVLDWSRLNLLRQCEFVATVGFSLKHWEE